MRKLLVIVLAAAMALPAWGQKTSMKKLESQRAQLEKEIAVINRQLKETSSKQEAALSSLSLVRSKISAREKLILGYDRTHRILDDSIHTDPHPPGKA